MKHALILLLTASAFAQPAALLPTPRPQFLDNSGNPLAGGKVYAFSAGTTSPLATYTDSTQSVANAHPIVLDSAGRAAIWLQNRSYKIELRNAAGSVIYTVDNVSDFGQILKRDLADTTSDSLNSAMVGFKAPSGVATNVRAKLIELSSLSGYNVMDYGAVGNGTTDDRAAIQATIDAAAAVGVPVVFPAGKVFGIADNLIMRTGTKLICPGQNPDGNAKPTQIKSLSSWNKQTSDALIENDQSTYAWGSMIQGCRLTGHATTGPDYGIRYLNGNVFLMRDILVDTFKLSGIFLDTDCAGCPGKLNQSAWLQNVSVYDVVLNTGLSQRYGALMLKWSDVYIDMSGFFAGPGGGVASYAEGGKKVSCLFLAEANNGHMTNSECSWGEVGLRIETIAWRFVSSRTQFSSGSGVEMTSGGNDNSFAGFHSQWNGRIVPVSGGGPFYAFDIAGTGNVFTSTSSYTDCPGNGSTGTIPYAFKFTTGSAPLNTVMGHNGTGCLGRYTATNPQYLVWYEDPLITKRTGAGAVPFIGANGMSKRSPHDAFIQEIGDDTRMAVGSENPIVISSATKANPMVLTLASSAPANWLVGRYVVITGATYADGNATNINMDPCWEMNAGHQISAVSGSSVTITFDGSTCNYKASSASAVLGPVDNLSIDRTGGASGAVASLGLRGRVAQFYMQDKRALATAPNASTWKWYTNFDEASQTYNEWILAGVTANDSAESRAVIISRQPASEVIKYIALPTGYAVVGDPQGDTGANKGKFQVYAGTLQMGGIAFAALPAGGQHAVWCTDCNVATPCTGGGAGAWAFRSGGTWKCPF